MTARTRTLWRHTAGSGAVVRVVGTYPPIFGLSRPLLAATTPRARPPGPGEPCAMIVYVRTAPGRYQSYSLEGGP